MIFLHHYPVNGTGFFAAGGSCAVSFFIILSGFVLSLGYREKVQQANFSYGKYMLKRAARNYPVHWLCLFVWIVLNISNLSKSDCLPLSLNFLLLQSWIPQSAVYFSGNALAWYLSDMLFFYAVYPVIERLIQKAKLWHIIAVLMVFMGLYLCELHYVPYDLRHAVFYINPLMRLFDFGLGVLLCNLLQRYKEHPILITICNANRGWQTAIEVIAISSVALSCVLYYHVPNRVYYAALYWLPMILLLFSCAKPRNGIINDILSCNWLYRLGDISFAFYMCHILVIQKRRHAYILLYHFK